MIKYIFLIFLILLFINLQFLKEGFNNKITSKLYFSKPYNWNKLGFNTKLRLYGKGLNKDYSLFSDKLIVKDYIKKLNIDELHIPKTLKILNKNYILNLSKLPQDCIIKSNCGSGDIIIIKNHKIIKMIARNQDKDNFYSWKKVALTTLDWKPEIEPHYKFIKPKIFIEEHLGTNIKDYKFYCIHGKVVFCHIDLNRFLEPNKKCRNIYDKNFKLLSFTKGLDNCKVNIKKPKKYSKMINIAEELSKNFEFVRVDLFYINNKIYFSELTFVPAAASDNIKPKKYDKIIGDLWF